MTKKALILLGCPESPSQTPLAIYTTNTLQKKGFHVSLACTPAASKLLEVSDPNKLYIKNKINIDKCIEGLEEGEYDLLVGFAHKDAAVSYFITFYTILNTKSVALVFEQDQELVDEFKSLIKENTNAEIVSARAFHNPTPIKVKLDKLFNEL